MSNLCRHLSYKLWISRGRFFAAYKDRQKSDAHTNTQINSVFAKVGVLLFRMMFIVPCINFEVLYLVKVRNSKTVLVFLLIDLSAEGTSAQTGEGAPHEAAEGNLAKRA